MDELLSEFLTETSEALSELDVELVRLEQNPNDQALLSNIFRLVHTIKGTCGFLGLPRLEAVAHASENVLGKIRDGDLEVTGHAITLILESIDRIKYLLGELESTETEPDGNDTPLINLLNKLAAGEAIDLGPAVSGEKIENSAADEGPGAHAGEFEVFDENDGSTGAASGDEVESAMGGQETVIGTRPGEVPLDELERIFQETEVDDVVEAGTGADEAASAEPEPTPEPAPAPPQPAASTQVSLQKDASQETPRESQVANQTIRVNVDLLENLMTMVSELVLTRNQLLQISRREKDSEFTVPLQRLSQVTSELQEGVMKTRMQPIGNAWSKLPRIIRDLANELDKKIDLVMHGADTELDRQVLELIKDPLTHMVRNSADHGIEGPDARVKIGKPENGRIILNAFHEGGHIIIEISDDGRGLDPEKLKAKAIANGLVGEAEAEGLTEQQIQQFIFRAGFSTAAQVTSVSGRGVGMDVVRTNIEKIGGTVELQSKLGVGSTFIIKIPLTLAIVSALIVEAAGERFAIPQLSVVELVRASSDSEHRIEQVHETPVLRLRNRLLPLVSLEDVLSLDRPEEETTKNKAETFIVVTQVGNYTFGILVDRVFDTEEIVVKPVAPILRHISLFSGNTILGDGSVIMILDPNGIAQSTGEITVTDSQQVEETSMVTSYSDQTISLLLFRGGGDRAPKAVPLSLVARLEEVDLKTVEYSEGRPLVQYRGQLMPLIAMDGSSELAEEGRQPVLVFSDSGRSMGLVVDEIVDIVEDRINVEVSTENAALMGSAVINGHATDVIDAGHYLTRAFGDWFKLQTRSKGEETDGNQILVVDDSAFFRNLLAPMLSVAGYSVLAVDSGEKALKLFNDGRMFDAMITDIEMPEMDGFELAAAVRATREWAELPIIALSSFTTNDDLERGRNVGLSDYVEKLDREALLESLAQVLDARVE